MIHLSDGGAYLVGGNRIVEDSPRALEVVRSLTGKSVTKEDAARQTISYGILEAHNTSGNMEKLKIRFDKLTSHDITFVGIIQTARASGLEKFPIPYVLTNCHNSLCAVGGTINEDDHMFGLSCARKYGGVYVPPHQAVIHQYAREMLAGGGRMILGSDSHTRYGALGTMAMGEGGPELVKQLLSQTYDINMPEVVAVYLSGDDRVLDGVVEPLHLPDGPVPLHDKLGDGRVVGDNALFLRLGFLGLGRLAAPLFIFPVRENILAQKGRSGGDRRRQHVVDGAVEGKRQSPQQPCRRREVERGGGSLYHLCHGPASLSMQIL